MKLKFVKSIRPGQNDIVCLTSEGSFSFKLGESAEVPDAAGHEIMAKWKGCFEVGASEAPKKSKKKEPQEDSEANKDEKMAEGYSNKAII